jgi:Trypsin-like peptidase domain
MRHTYLATVLLALCFGSAAMAQTRPARVLEAPEARLPESARPARSYPRLALPSRSNPEITSADVPRLTLPPLDLVRVRRERDLRRNRLPDPDAAPDDPTRIPRTPRAQEIGINRDVQVSGRDGRWFSVGAGRSWILEITSTAAYETRLHFKDFQLPPGAKLYIGSPSANSEPTYFTVKGPFGTGEFWSPIVNGDTIHLELLDDANGALEQLGTLPFLVTSVGHVYEDGSYSGFFGSSAPCELDFTCYPNYATTGRSVAKIQFSDLQYIYNCSAVLLNNNSGDFSPLLLTAHHCISSDALAQTVSVDWYYQSTACNSTSYDPGLGSNYATLLATTLDDTDASLLKILGWVPNDATWAAWTTQDPDIGSGVTGIHHPHADPKKISFGKHVSDQETYRHYVMWDSGIMEPGSSGSPLFNANNQVVGQLWGGESTCSVAGPDVYGKLRLSEPQLTGPNGWNYLEKGIPDDPYVPNQTRDTAASLSFPGSYSLVAKVHADDWWRVTVGPGQSVAASVTFDGTHGSISSEVYVGPATQPLTGVQISDTYPYAYANTTDQPVDLFFHIYFRAPYDTGVRVDYKITLSVPPQPTVTTFSLLGTLTYGRTSLSGLADTGGWQPTGWFDWGTDPTLSSSTRISASVGQYRPQFDLSAGLLGLTPATTYYYRAGASTSGGQAQGSILSFATPAFPAPQIYDPPQGQLRLQTSPSLLAVYAGGESFDLYVGTDPNPPLVPLAAYEKSLYDTAYISFRTGPAYFSASTHYYWRVVAHYQGASVSSPISDFITPDIVTASPPSASFTPVLVGTSSTMVLQLTSWTSTNFLSFSVSGDSFTAVPPTVNCLPCGVPVTFHPTSAGLHTGALTVSAVNGSTTIPLTGTGFDMSLTRPSRPQRPGVVSAGQPQQMAFRFDTINVPGEVSLSCEVIPALANCEVSSRSVSGSGTHDLSVTLHTSRRGPQKLRGRSEDPDTVDLGTPPGSYTVRVTAAFAGATRTIDFPLQVR